MHEEWQSGERRYLSVGSIAQLKPTRDTGGIAAIDSGEQVVGGRSLSEAEQYPNEISKAGDQP
jgi:hypothetical protein